MSTHDTVVRVGVFHSAKRCAFCGDTNGHLVEFTVPATRARGMRCDDIGGCEMRRYKQKSAA